jgi:peptidoglycan/LPS O-acetylase OafA/YrhL
MKITRLESLRGFAAIYVLLSHLSSNYLHAQGSWIGQPFRYAQEGVLLFFLLSGFVIYYSWHEHRGTKNFAHFFYKRFRRIYPIFFLALLLAYAVTCLAKGFHAPDLGQLLGNLFMTQGFEHDPGWQSQPFMGNGPLWSLSYEWWFYMMFYPLYVYVPAAAQKYIVLAISLIGVIGAELSPNIFFHILASFPLWWCGVEFAREYVAHRTFTLRRQAGTIALLTLVGLAHACVVYHWKTASLPLNVIDYPLVKLRHYAVGLVLVFLFFAWRKTGYIGFDWTLGRFEIFAGMSYAIYVLHYPIICNLPSLTPPSSFYLNVAAKVALVLVLAFFAEEVWQKKVNRWLDHLVWGRRTK